AAWTLRRARYWIPPSSASAPKPTTAIKDTATSAERCPRRGRKQFIFNNNMISSFPDIPRGAIRAVPGHGLRLGGQYIMACTEVAVNVMGPVGKTAGVH